MVRVWLILTMLFLGVASSVNAQFNFYVGGGYNFGFAKNDQLDYIIGEYNSNNPSVVQPMPTLNSLHGPVFNMAVLAGIKSIHIDYTPKTTILSSTIYDSQGNLSKANIKLNTDAVGLTFGAFPTPGTHIAMGFGMTFKYFRSEYHLMGDVFGPEYQTWNSAAIFNQLTIAPMIQFFIGLSENVFFYLKPEYQFVPFPANYYDFHGEVNPDFYQKDKNRNMMGRLNQFIIEGGLVVSFEIDN